MEFAAKSSRSAVQENPSVATPWVNADLRIKRLTLLELIGTQSKKKQSKLKAKKKI